MHYGLTPYSSLCCIEYAWAGRGEPALGCGGLETLGNKVLYFISVPLRRRITQKSGDDVVTGADLVVSLEYILTQLSMSIVALYRTSTSRRDGDTGSHGRATGQFPPRSRTVASRGPRS